MIDRRPAFVLVAAVAAACGAAKPKQEPAMTDRNLDAVSERYVKLMLAMGEHEPAFVDAYYGPPEWRAEVQRDKPSLAQIRADATALVARIEALPPATDELGALRRRFLVKHLRALLTRIEMNEGKKLAFDDESRALYDAVAPTIPEARFEESIARLDALLPGPGALLERIDALRDNLIIPRDKLDAVFAAAIRECRARTLKHIALPDSESFTVEYVDHKPWAAYNWYKGDYRSVIQVNTDLPVYLDRALDLACHEGYPGHHVMGILVEQRLVRERGFRELTVLPLYSPTGLIAEGSANYGIELAFPGDERVAFESGVLAPLAGLDPARARKWAEVARLLKELKHAGNQAGRRYLDGEIDAAAAADYLRRYTLVPSERARKLVTFMDVNRSYIINYNLGEDLVARWIDRQAGSDPARRWSLFERLISSPMTAGEL